MPTWLQIMILLLGTSTLFTVLLVHFSWTTAPIGEADLEASIDLALAEARGDE